MWLDIFGWVAGSKIADELRMRRFKAEVAAAERRQQQRALQAQNVRSIASMYERAFRSKSRAARPLDPYSHEALQLHFTNKHNTFDKRHPAPTCCPQYPGGHLVRRYSPWIQANHDKCAVQPPKPVRHVRWADLLPKPKAKDYDREHDYSKSIPPAWPGNPLEIITEESEAEDDETDTEEESTGEAVPEDDDDDILTGKLRLTSFGRYTHASNADLKWVRAKILDDFNAPGANSSWGSRMLATSGHPLLPIYNKRRDAAIAAGEPVPPSLTADELEWSIANKIRDKRPKPEVYTDEQGVKVQRGFPGPNMTKRTLAYSSTNTFSEWRFADANISFDNETTRLKEFARDGTDSVLKLVVADKEDGPVGTTAFMQANEHKDQEQDAVNDDFAAQLKQDERAARVDTNPTDHLADLFAREEAEKQARIAVADGPSKSMDVSGEGEPLSTVSSGVGGRVPKKTPPKKSSSYGNLIGKLLTRLAGQRPGGGSSSSAATAVEQRSLSPSEHSSETVTEPSNEPLQHSPSKTMSDAPIKSPGKMSAKSASKASSILSGVASPDANKVSEVSTKQADKGSDYAIESGSDAVADMLFARLGAKASRAPVKTTMMSASAELELDTIAGWRTGRELSMFA